MKKILLCIIVSIIFVTAKGQVTLFNQYESTPALVNPASVSELKKAEIGLLYHQNNYFRTLTYKSYYLNVLLPGVYKIKANEGSVGLSLLKDDLSGQGVFSTTGVGLTISQQVRISSKSYLSLGFSGNYYQKKIGGSRGDFTTGSQWQPSLGFNPELPINENSGFSPANYFGLNTGAYYYAINSFGRSRIKVGASVMNFNKPEIKFIEKVFELPHTYIAYAGVSVYDNGKIAVLPDALYCASSGINYTAVGNTLSYFFENESPYAFIKSGSIDFITRYFHKRGVSCGLRLNQDNYSVAFSYEIPVLKKNVVSSGANTQEIRLSFRADLGKKKNKQVLDVPTTTEREVRELFVRAEEGQEEAKQKIPNVVEKKDKRNKEMPMFRFQLKKDFKFSFNDTEIKDSRNEFIEEIYTFMNHNKSIKIEIIGHSDDIGTDSMNYEISLKRARSLANILMERGISAHRIKTKGKGAFEPMFPNNNQENRQKNRRVEVILFND